MCIILTFLTFQPLVHNIDIFSHLCIMLTSLVSILLIMSDYEPRLLIKVDRQPCSFEFQLVKSCHYSLSICYNYAMVFSHRLACFWQGWCPVTVNLFISFTDSHTILIVGQWIVCVTLTWPSIQTMYICLKEEWIV